MKPVIVAEKPSQAKAYGDAFKTVKREGYMEVAPNPIFPGSIANWMIMDSGWAAANGTERPDKEAGNFATLNANGTGPYKLVSREPDVRTVRDPIPLRAATDWLGRDILTELRERDQVPAPSDPVRGSPASPEADCRAISSSSSSVMHNGFSTKTFRPLRKAFRVYSACESCLEATKTVSISSSSQICCSSDVQYSKP